MCVCVVYYVHQVKTLTKTLFCRRWNFGYQWNDPSGTLTRRRDKRISGCQKRQGLVTSGQKRRFCIVDLHGVSKNALGMYVKICTHVVHSPKLFISLLTVSFAVPQMFLKAVIQIMRPSRRWRKHAGSQSWWPRLNLAGFQHTLTFSHHFVSTKHIYESVLSH